MRSLTLALFVTAIVIPTTVRGQAVSECSAPALDIPDAHPFGHRGISHSLAFALVLAGVLGLSEFRKAGLSQGHIRHPPRSFSPTGRNSS